MNDYKRQEIKEYFNNFIKENDEAIIEDNDFYDDIHHHCFNTDYYIIGIDKAKKWLNNETLDIINIIKDYEQSNFGEVITDLSDAEKIVNMYVYMIGEEIVNDWKENIDGDRQYLTAQSFRWFLKGINKNYLAV